MCVCFAFPQFPLLSLISTIGKCYTEEQKEGLLKSEKQKVDEVKVQKKKKLQIGFQIWRETFFEGFEESNLTSNYPVTRSVPPSKSHQGLHEFSDCLPQAFPGVRKRRWVRSKAGGGQANSKPCTWQGFLCTGHKMTPFPQRPLAAGASARLILSQRSLLGWR